MAPTYWSYDHTLRLYPLPTALVMCDTSGWVSFKVTYEGCCVINTGSLLRVDQREGRGRYTAAWWEWDCGNREGKEIVVGINERVEREPAKEKKERKRKVVEKNGQLENAQSDNRRLELGRKNDRMLEEVEFETQIEETDVENQMKDVVFGEDTQILA